MPNAPLTWSERGSLAVDAGDLATAKQCFSQAVRSDGRNAKHRFHLAVVLEGLGEYDGAAERLTQALHLDPRMADAARRLSLLIDRFSLDARLDRVGLKYALHHDHADREAIARGAIRYLSAQSPLADALAKGQSQGWLAVARTLCLAKSGQLLRDELFLDIVRCSIIRRPALERLLTAVRSVLLLEAPRERFRDRALVGFIIALMHQCRLNEYVWAVSPEESQRLADEPVELAMLLGGDAAAGRVFLLHALYQSPARILGERCAPTVVANMRPELLRDAVGQFLLTEEQERAKAIGVPRLGAILDVTSRQVAQQYEAYPYPRWTSAAAMREKEFRRALTGFFGHQRLSFLDAPFEVLIAGCGTGQHAVLSALEYAKHGRVLALDLSLASLGYAARMADHFGLTNVEFAQADLQDLHSTDARYASRYQVIECVGVLHHMSDPFAGWRSLLKCLAPGGIMRIGLYSAAARRSLTALRADPEYPGPGCDDTALRAYRQKLMALEGEQGRELRSYFDFYATGPFRDLVLHVSERSFNLDEIERFMREENLVFRGFQLDKQRVDLFSRRFPAIWPGSLVQWAELEREWPDLFSAMYLFWCDKS